MPEFNYVAADKSGKKITGKASAVNEGELRMALRGQGLRPLNVSQAGVGDTDVGELIRGFLGNTDHVPQDRMMNFLRQLQTMISAGVPLMQALELLHEQESHPTLNRILGASKERVSQGKFLWEAFSSYPNTFEPVTIAMIQAGEQTGTIDVMLKRIGKYMENAHRLKKLVQGAMYYPIGVIAVACLVITVMLGYVIPKFEEMLTEGGQQLPAITQMVITVSHTFQNYFWFIVGGVVIAFFVVRSYIRTAEGRALVQTLQLRIPLFGTLAMKSGVARLSRTMSTLLASGVPLLDVLDISRGSSGNVMFENAVKNMRREVEMGQSLGVAMMQQPIFPKMVSQMCVVGENTGALDKMLERVADFYEEEVESTVSGMTKLIEPALIVILGGIIMVILIAMYMPIFKMAGSAGA